MIISSQLALRACKNPKHIWLFLEANEKVEEYPAQSLVNGRFIKGENSMLAPCLGKFGGIETFCLTLIEDLIHKGASVRLLRKKVAGFQDDGSIQKTKTKSVHLGQKMKTNDLPASLFTQRCSNQKCHTRM